MKHEVFFADNETGITFLRDEKQLAERNYRCKIQHMTLQSDLLTYQTGIIPATSSAHLFSTIVSTLGHLRPTAGIQMFTPQYLHRIKYDGGFIFRIQIHLGFR